LSLAERFDDDPFLIFAMRGKEKEVLLEELGRERGSVEPDLSPETLPTDNREGDIRAPLTPAGFYDLRSPLDDFRVHLTSGPEVRGALLRRLGPSPLFIGKKNFMDLIAPVYEFGPEHVRRIVHGYDNGHEKK
jgi:uncharacterized Zn finger protein